MVRSMEEQERREVERDNKRKKAETLKKKARK